MVAANTMSDIIYKVLIIVKVDFLAVPPIPDYIFDTYIHTYILPTLYIHTIYIHYTNIMIIHRHYREDHDDDEKLTPVEGSIYSKFKLQV